MRVGHFYAPMEQPKASYSSSMQQHVFGMTISSGGPAFDRKAYAPFQAIIEKGKQAKAQDEHDQYEARKAKRETDIKNAARIRHAEAEANRRRAEESKLSVDDHKGKLVDEMTKNVRAILENQYREEIREKVYEDEDKIVSIYEHDIKDQTKARLVRELESVVKAKLEAEYEPKVKQQLAVELVSVVKAELRAEYETEVKQQLVKDFGPEVEAELRARYETQVKQQLAEEHLSGVKAELRAKYEEEIKHQLMIDLKPIILHKLKNTHKDDAKNGTQGQADAAHTLDGKPFEATPNDVDDKAGDYPDLSHHQDLVNKDGVRDGQEADGSFQNLEGSEVDGVAVDVPHGIKRSLSGEEDEGEDPYARHPKRSRSASFNSEEQQLTSGYQEGVSDLNSGYSPHIQQPYQGVRYKDEEDQGFPQNKANASCDDAQGSNGYKTDRRASGYNSSDVVQGIHENILDRRGAEHNSAEDVQGMDANFLDGEGAYCNGVEDDQGTDENLLHHEEADYDSEEDVQGMNGNFLNGEGEGYDSAEDIQGDSGYQLEGEVTESYSSEQEDEDEYESEEEERYSTAPQAATHSNAGPAVITFSNTQDTAFVLSDSEDDEDTGPTTMNDAKHHNEPGEESLFLDA